ncbi:alanine--tRNA ligase [Chitinispirillales bacterium ANBcel5]|uniref:alanine--tRNA ligase n=1 Tax=Cellulosispirillum alkaliphilum TaxID=3039283 RepID=UPI002A536923|nr:alanine--tRNA ligase [Chitinispirillales bacterium ANBcel5]
MKSSNEIRKEFIRFFEKRDHTLVPSAPVVPQDDPTLLFTNAGMNQFKSIFLGDNPRGLKRAVNSQKCMRVSGKHNDLEEVGRDHYHHTFFEMLGNWSFGDYYKKEAIKWAWELLTEVWKLPKDRLFATVYKDDDEALAIWKSETDIAHDRIMRFGEESNFWEMGETGPCGPCSEIHFDTGDASTREATFNDPLRGVNGENDRYRELWNLVFIQYNREKNGSLSPLPACHVDTGMGFERIVSVIQGVDSNYDTDLFRPIISELEKMSGKAYSNGPQGTPFRVIGDHIRALVFAVTDGAFPSNEGRGYVLRRILRRAYRFGRELGFKDPFLYKLVPVLIKNMGEAFDEIAQRQSYLEEVIRSEEERFGATLEQGIEKFETMVKNSLKSGSKKLSGSDLFTLYDTYGFPMDLTRLMASEMEMGVDEEGYAQLMKQQKERAREARKGEAGGLSPEGWVELREASGTAFVGYDSDSTEVNVCRYKRVEDESAKVVYLLILDKTPFYAEAGGQVGDRGLIQTSSGTELVVEDTFKWNDLVIHKCKSGTSLSDEDLKAPLTAEIDTAFRSSTRCNHTATHLLQAALRAVLGNHVQQSGSRVDPWGLRFDFTHFKALTSAELKRIEQLVNEWIMEDYSLVTDVMGADEAKSQGATALFGEKYGEKVRVITIGEISKELCGGTHVLSTGRIGMFHIVGEESVSAGIRRISAITGMETVNAIWDKEMRLSQLGTLLKCAEGSLVEKVSGLLDTVKDLEGKLKTYNVQRAKESVAELFREAEDNKGEIAFSVKDMGEVDKEAFLGFADAISDTIKQCGLNSVVILIGARVGEKALFAAGAGKDAVSKGIRCGDLVKTAAKITGGGGGGSPHRAQAGGKDYTKIQQALKEVKEQLSQKANI